MGTELGKTFGVICFSTSNDCFAVMRRKKPSSSPESHMTLHGYLKPELLQVQCVKTTTVSLQQVKYHPHLRIINLSYNDVHFYCNICIGLDLIQ